MLFWLTVGAVRGFAFFLGLSTLLAPRHRVLLQTTDGRVAREEQVPHRGAVDRIRSGLGDAEHRVVAAPAGAADDHGRRRPARAEENGARWAGCNHGETNIDFIGRTKLWFALSGVFLLIGLAR